MATKEEDRAKRAAAATASTLIATEQPQATQTVAANVVPDQPASVGTTQEIKNPYRGKVAQPEAPNTLSDHIEKYQQQLEEKKRDVEHRRQSSMYGLLTDFAMLMGDQNGANNNARVNVREMSGQQQAQEADRLHQDYMAAKNRLPDIENQLKLQEYQRQLGLFDKNNALADAWDKQYYDRLKWGQEQQLRAAEAEAKANQNDVRNKIEQQKADAAMINAKKPRGGRGGSEKESTDLILYGKTEQEDIHVPNRDVNAIETYFRARAIEKLKAEATKNGDKDYLGNMNNPSYRLQLKDDIWNVIQNDPEMRAELSQMIKKTGGFRPSNANSQTTPVSYWSPPTSSDERHYKGVGSQTPAQKAFIPNVLNGKVLNGSNL